MTIARHSASPAVSGIAGTGSLPGVQAAVAGSSPAKFRPSDFALGGAQPQASHGLLTGRPKLPPRRVATTCVVRPEPTGPSAPFNDCGVSDAQNLRTLKGAGNGFQSASRLNSRKGAVLPARAPRPEKPGPQSPICPELTAYITVLLSVIGAVAWAHVFAMNTTLANQLINFHPRVMFCDAVGNRAEKLCAVRHKGAE